jgi:hypothetical protein
MLFVPTVSEKTTTTTTTTTSRIAQPYTDDESLIFGRRTGVVQHFETRVHNFSTTEVQKL